MLKRLASPTGNVGDLVVATQEARIGFSGKFRRFWGFWNFWEIDLIFSLLGYIVGHPTRQLWSPRMGPQLAVATDTVTTYGPPLTGTW